MNTKKLAIGTVAAAVLALGGIGFAAAQTADEPSGDGAMHGSMADHGQMGDAAMHNAMDGTGDMPCDADQQGQMHEAVATALGITIDELNTQLAAGKTVAEIAAAKGIDFETVRAAMQTARPAGHGMGGMHGASVGAN